MQNLILILFIESYLFISPKTKQMLRLGALKGILLILRIIQEVYASIFKMSSFCLFLKQHRNNSVIKTTWPTCIPMTKPSLLVRYHLTPKTF